MSVFQAYLEATSIFNLVRPFSPTHSSATRCLINRCSLKNLDVQKRIVSQFALITLNAQVKCIYLAKPTKYSCFVCKMSIFIVFKPLTYWLSFSKHLNWRSKMKTFNIYTNPFSKRLSWWMKCLLSWTPPRC